MLRSTQVFARFSILALRKDIILRALAYSFIFLVFLSCTKDHAFDCFKSTGKSAHEIRYPGSFDYLVSKGKIDVTIFKGSEYKVEVVAGKNLIKNITTAVTGNTLTIDNTSKCNFVRGYKHQVKVYVTVPYIRMASNEGVATLRFDEGFSQDTLVVRVSDIGDMEVNGTFNQLRSSTHGGGDTYVSGSANSFMVYASGTNYLHAKNLIVRDYVYIQTLSLGNIFLNGWGLKQLDYDIASGGNILYTGQPVVINNYSKQGAKGHAERID